MEILKINKIADFDYLNMFETLYLDKDRNEKTWLFVSRTKTSKCVSGQFEMPDAVVIVPFHKDKKRLVIINEFRAPLGGYQYGFPAGLVDDGETIQDACRRELKEETGLNLIRIAKISPPVYSSSGMTDESVSMVYVECDGEPSNTDNTSSEDIETVFISPSQAAKLCEDSSIKFDVKTWLVLSEFADTGRILHVS